MTELNIVVDDIKYLVRSSDLKKFNIYSENIKVYEIMRTVSSNIYYKWVTENGYHGSLIEKLGLAVHQQLLLS
jgi:hypothetical protein